MSFVSESDDFGDVLLGLLVAAEKNKRAATDSDLARNWAVLRTNLEEAFAYYEVYLKPKPIKGDS